MRDSLDCVTPKEEESVNPPNRRVVLDDCEGNAGCSRCATCPECAFLAARMDYPSREPLADPFLGPIVPNGIDGNDDKTGE